MLSLEMNDRVAVVGSAFTADLMRHATLWQNGTLTDLGVPAGEQESIGCDVNNLNRVVGAVTHDFLVASAATWQNGSWTLLPAIEPGAASDPLKPFVRLEAAVFVNIRGDIVAVGFDSRVPWRSKSLRLVRE